MSIVLTSDKLISIVYPMELEGMDLLRAFLAYQL